MNKKKWTFLIITAAIFAIGGIIANIKYPDTMFNYIGFAFAGMIILAGIWETFKNYLNK